MIRRVVQFCILLSVLVFFTVSQAAFSLLDESLPYGSQGTISITQIETASKTEAIAKISEIAQKNRVNLLKIQPKLDDSSSSWVLYAFVGDKEAYQRDYGSGYPNFSPGSGSVTVKSAVEITTEDLRGKYAVTGDSSTVQQVAADLNDARIVAQPDHVSSAIAWVLAIGRTHLAGVIAAAMVTLALVLAYWVSQQKKVYAIRKIHGYSGRSKMLYTLGQTGYDLILSFLMVFIGGNGYLYFHNSFAQFTRFWIFCSTAMGVLAVFVLAVTICSILLFGNVNVVKAIKGEKDVLKVGILAVIVEVLLITIVAVTVNSTVARSDAVRDALQASQAWDTGKPLYALRLSVTGTHTDDEKAAPLFNEVVHRMDSEGKMLLAYQDHSLNEDHPYAYGGPRSIIVNNNYLSRQKIFDINGKRVINLPQEKDAFFILVPENYPGSIEQLSRDYSKQLASMCRFGMGDNVAPCKPHPTVITIKSGQRLPTYGQTADMPIEYQGQALVTDPVLTVVNAKSDLIAPLDYISYASSGALLFEDPEMLRSLLEQKGILENFQGIDNAADSVTRSIQISRNEIKMDVFSLILSTITFIIAIFILAMAYCDRNKKIIFVRKIHGFRFYARHRAYVYLTTAVCILSAVLAVVIYHPKPLINSFTASGLTLVALILTMIVLHVYEKRMQADYIKRD